MDDILRSRQFAALYAAEVQREGVDVLVSRHLTSLYADEVQRDGLDILPPFSSACRRCVSFRYGLMVSTCCVSASERESHITLRSITVPIGMSIISTCLSPPGCHIFCSSSALASHVVDTSHLFISSANARLQGASIAGTAFLRT
jgi:hypothetical protein